MDEAKKSFPTFEEFWPYYLSQHSKRETRLIHFAGIFLGVCSIAKGIFTFKIGWVFLAPIIGYVFAWAAHVFIEQNRPVTFEYPVWSLKADFHMLKLWLTGELTRELERNEVRS